LFYLCFVRNKFKRSKYHEKERKQTKTAKVGKNGTCRRCGTVRPCHLARPCAGLRSLARPIFYLNPFSAFLSGTYPTLRWQLFGIF